MHKRLLILLLAAMVTIAACSKHSAKQPENQQSSDQSQQTPTQSANPQGNVSSPPANPEPTPPAATPTPQPTPAPAPAAPAVAAAPARATETAPPKPEPPKALVIPAGTVITVRTTEPLSSKDSQAGDTFHATVAEPVSVRGKSVIPTSASARGTVVDAEARGKIHGEARLELALKQITIRGTTYPIETSLTTKEQKGKGKRSAATTGAGALIGGIAGGGKGMLIGGAAGLAGGAFTGNKQIELPAESMLSFELKKPLTLK